MRIAPDARIIDITHGIPPQAVLQGALVLANTLPRTASSRPRRCTWTASAMSPST
ncbi:MAG: SAM-dependent chlorinase/fluorinase [Thermoleophilia bacterium]|nr:SAM-dependent chlorinase/fluorinase [Thermoleophilia bacterium]